jgi:hypothetical protein
MGAIQLTEEQWRQVASGARTLELTPDQDETLQLLQEAADREHAAHPGLTPDETLFLMQRQLRKLEAEVSVLRGEVANLNSRLSS